MKTHQMSKENMEMLRKKGLLTRKLNKITRLENDLQLARDDYANYKLELEKMSTIGAQTQEGSSSQENSDSSHILHPDA